MKKRGNSWILVVALLSSALTFTGTNFAQAASTVTTTTMTPSVSTPTYGDLVTFTVTVTPTEYSIPVTGNVVITGRNGGGALCETSNLIETGPGRTVTGTCTWIARSSASLNYNDIKATYNGLKNASNVLVYGSSSSSTFSGFKVLGVTNLSVPRMVDGSNGNTLTVTANSEGVVRFKVDGQEISGCGSKSVNSPNFTATCSYNLPVPTNSFQASHVFTVDFTPTGKTIVLNQFTKKFTPDSYYLPRTCTNTNCNIYQSTYANFNGASDATPYVNAGYVRVNNIFYKLNRSTMEAMAVGYDKFQGITALTFPEVLTVPSAAVPSGESLFAGTYSITAIGAWAFTLNTAWAPHTLMTSVTLPSTLKVIGEFAFRGQCGITTLDLPDSLEYVGQTAFGSMSKFGSGFAGCTGAAELGLKTIKFGAGFVALWGGVMTGNSDITTLSFRGAPSDLLPLGEFYELGVENWQVTASTQNQYMNPFVEVSNNSCLSNLNYTGNLQVNVLALQSDAWKYWAQGCLTGITNFAPTLLKPSRPAIPTASQPTINSVKVDFSAPKSNGGTAITSYSIQYTSDDWATFTTVSSILAAATSYTVTGLSQSTNYKFKVIASNSEGSSSPSDTSAPISTLTPTVPGAPTIASVSGVTPTSATVAITAPASNGGSVIDKYVVSRSPGTSSNNVELVQATSGTVTFTGLTAATEYTFSAIAHNAVGNSSTSTGVTFTTAAKIAPTISSFTVPALTVNSAATFTAVSNIAGIFAFKIGGSDISGCGTQSAAGSSSTFTATCSYTPADGSAKTFTLDFTPTNTGDYSSLSAQNSTQVTPGKLNPTVSAFTVPALAVNTAATLSATASVAGAFTFKENGTAISGCASQATAGSVPFSATCSYTPATGTLKTFTVSFVPTATTVYNSLSDVSLTTSTPSKINTELAGFANLQKSASDAPFQLTAPVVTGSIPGTFTYAVSNSAIATITDTSTVTMVGAGTVVITATFTPTDSGSFNSSTKALTLVVSSLANTITFAALNAVTVLTAPFNLTATATGGTVTFATPTSSSICTLNNGLVTPVGPGTCTIVASNNGNAVYGAASSVTRTLTINAVAPGAPTITSLSVGGSSATNNASGYATIRYSGTVENGASISSFTLIATPDTGTVVSAVVNLAAGTRTSTITGLTLGTRYTFTVKATNSIGSSIDSNSISKTPTANPEAPTNLIVTPGNTTLVATWSAINLGGATFTSYDVYLKRSADGSFPGTANFSISNINTTTQEFTSLTNGVAYDVKVQAVTTANGTSSALNTAAVYLIPSTIPSAPRITLSQSDTSTVTVRWNSNGDGGSALTGYTIAVTAGGTAQTCNFTFAPGTTEYSCAITGLTGGSTVSATAIATNLIGNSATTTAVPLKFIGAILAPTAAVVTNGSTQAVVAFTINENGDQIVSFEYSFDGISFLPLAGTTSPLTFTGLTNGTSYSLYIRGKGAVNGVGATSAAFILAPVAPAPVVVVTPVTPAPVVVTGPPPSSLKTVTSPKISRDDKGYYCEMGKYVFLREGRTEETPKLTTRVFSLLLNGKVIETLKSAVDKVSFTKSDTYLDSTLTCQVEVGQENLTVTSYSLNSIDANKYSLAKKDAIEAADAKYYKDRQDAYTKKDLEFARLLAIKNTAIATSKTSKDTLASSLTYQKAYSAASNLWKQELVDAATNRVLAKELAQKQYLDALEAAGISIYPVAVRAVVTPTPTPTPTSKPTPTPTPSPTATNVQPTSEMKKVGTLYMASGTYFLNDASKISLKALALKIKASDKSSVLVYGHTDSRGGVNNTTLSQNRAKAVANYLRPLLKGKKIVIGWYASRKPVTTGTTAADLAKNRRVEIYTK